MEYYVGLDVSLKQTSICVVNQTGSIVQEGVVDPDPEAIASFVRSRAAGTVRIGIETGPTTTWLWTELYRLGLPVICIDARHAKAVLNGRHALVGLLRQSVFGRLAGYEDVNDAERLRHDPAMR